MSSAAANTRFFPGEVYSESEVLGFRHQFFLALSRVLPEVEDTLRSDVLPVYSSLEFPKRYKQWKKLTSRLDPDLQPFRRALTDWGRRWNVSEVDWINGRALKILFQWASSPALVRHSLMPVSSAAGWAAVADAEKHFTFEHPGWTPNRERWRDFKKAVEDDFKARLQLYKDEMLSLSKARGYIARPGNHSPEHFDYYVLYRCGGLELNEIALRDGPRDERQIAADISRIHKGIEQVAGLLNLDHTKASWKP